MSNLTHFNSMACSQLIYTKQRANIQVCNKNFQRLLEFLELFDRGGGRGGGGKSCIDH